MLLKWHPTAEGVIGTTALDATLKIWDIQNKTAVSTHNIGGTPWGMDWNNTGT